MRIDRGKMASELLDLAMTTEASEDTVRLLIETAKCIGGDPLGEGQERAARAKKISQAKGAGPRGIP